MLTGWKLKLAPLWAPIAPAIFIGIVCFVIRILVTDIADENIRAGLPPVWQNAQSGVVLSIPDPVFIAIGAYLVCVPFVYLTVGKILQDKALKERGLGSGESDVLENGGDPK